MDGDKIVWVQKGKPCDSTVTRHLEDNGNTMVEVSLDKGGLGTK